MEPKDIIPIFLQTCPEFQTRWDNHLAWWNGGSAGVYNDLEVFARFVVDSYQSGNTDQFPKIFRTIESLINSGNQDISELTKVGLLEDIQTISLNRGLDIGAYSLWFEDSTAQAWRAIANLWQGKESLMDVVTEEVRRKRELGK